MLKVNKFLKSLHLNYTIKIHEKCQIIKKKNQQNLGFQIQLR